MEVQKPWFCIVLRSWFNLTDQRTALFVPSADLSCWMLGQVKCSYDSMLKESRLANRLGVKYPILQSPIGSMAGVEIASAVSNSGGLGSLALTWTTKETVAELVRNL